ncbi:TrbC/VirB2 family protein [Rickettsia endosymbiont of Cardiosporidium cionae]|uniref:TrbC/VirB2 family protein n=1 Tax=Rickettsia endosymbiont of Cardiosporidium cionae TaxID=2777155 RepID=UPI00189498C3|nr:TrbC/VirB2 family protein [Rickettsia endosymbiont of Cardiosporidium cionae]KAF8818826.1 hypothetical protein IHI24_000060 [Rickettsia endosymbiont of Cardiosporidium cionae]
MRCFDIGYNLIFRFIVFLFLTNAIMFSYYDVVFAVGTDVIGDTLCNLISNLQGTIGKAIATLAIFAVGIGLFLGKASWTIAATTAVGVGIVFGAGQIVDWLNIGTVASCTTTTTP